MRPNAREVIEGIGDPVFRLRDGGRRSRELLAEM
jgi:hypothetical protein